MNRSSLVVLAMCLGAVALGQDVQLGGSRSAGMGGAGLAYPGNIGQIRSNPGLLGFQKLGFKTKFPTLGYHTRGISWGNAADTLGSIGSGGLSPGKLGNFAKQFGDSEKSFGLYGDLGVNFGPLVVAFGADALATTIPSRSLQQSVQNGTVNFGGNDALDGYGYGYHSLDVAYGHAFKPRTDELETLAVGAKLRVMKGYYSHHIARGNDITTGGGSTPAPEMYGQDVQSKTGLGIDLGFQGISGRERNVYFAATIENFIAPNMGFNSTLPYDSTNGTPGETRVNPFRPRWNVGFAYSPKQQIILAADWVDLYNHRGEKEFRLGAEFMANEKYGVRAGVASRNGMTFGFTIEGFNISFSKRNPIQVASGFRF